jgi:hypothetical protein
MPEIHSKHTPCKDCIFAQYGPPNEKTQFGCFLNELFYLKNAGFEILEVYDEEKEFYVINDTVCMKKRYPTWTHAKGYDRSEQVKQIDQEIAIEYAAIILENSNPFGVQKTIQSLINQQLKPKCIIVIVRNNSGTNSRGYIPLLNHLGIAWKIENFINDYNDSQLIDYAVAHIKEPIYSVFQAGFIIPALTFYDINSAVHNDFLNFAMLTPNSTNNGMVVVRQAHNQFGGNIEQTLEEKLDTVTPLCKYPITQILPYFPK